MDDLAKNDTCKKSLVKLDADMGLVCMILNVIPFTTGIGTMISACIGKEFNATALLFGILQLLTAILIIGYIWSIIHGIWLYRLSKGA